MRQGKVKSLRACMIAATVCFIIALCPLISSVVANDGIAHAASAGTAARMVEIANSCNGMYYSDTKSKLKSYGKKLWRSSYGNNGEPWCAWFVSNCAVEAGVKSSIIERNTCADREFYMNNGVYYDSKYWGGKYTPKKGDLIFFNWDGESWPSQHIGIVRSSNSKTVYTVEGNSSNMVKKKSYRLDSSYILGYAALKYTSRVDYNLNGGKGKCPAQSVPYGQKFTVCKNKPTKSGKEFRGYYVQRLKDKKWFVPDKGWVSWDKIVKNNYKPKLYSCGQTRTMDDSWTRNGGQGSDFRFHAQWK